MAIMINSKLLQNENINCKKIFKDIITCSIIIKEMYYNDNFDPANENDNELFQDDDDFKNMLEKTKRMDKGYSKILRRYINYEGLLKIKQIDLYTSGGFGNFIRDAESGTYYKNKVGTLDEDLFFKVCLSTGEIKSSNGSNKLFYLTPYHYMKHLMCEVSQDTIREWETKRNIRLNTLNKTHIISSDYVVVK